MKRQQKRQRRRLVLGLLALVIISYVAWSRWDRGPLAGPAQTEPMTVLTYGHDTGHGNLLGIQPLMEQADYSSAARFSRKLDSYFAAAQQRGLLGEKTVVVLPEYIGTWLVAVGEKRSVFGAPTLDRAAQTMVLSNLPSFLRHAVFAAGAERARYALFRMKADTMAAAYQQTFATLARKYRVWIVAGSIVLPSPAIRNRALVAGTGPLQNVSVLYAPDGEAQSPVVRKVFLIDAERGFTTPAQVSDLPVFATPAGRLGVLVCADSWYPDPYQELSRKGAQCIVVPSLIPGKAGEDAWLRPWEGYQGNPPSDVEARDVARIETEKAWLKYAMAHRLPDSSATAGLNVFFRGQLWDMAAGGRATAVLGEDVLIDSDQDAPLVTLWLEAPAQALR